MDVGHFYANNVSVMKIIFIQLTGETAHDLHLVDDFLQVVGLNLAGHDLHHLLANLTDLLVLGVGRLSDLVGALLCEAPPQQTQKIAVGGLHIPMGFNHSLSRKNKSILVRLIRNTTPLKFKRDTFQFYMHYSVDCCLLCFPLSNIPFYKQGTVPQSQNQTAVWFNWCWVNTHHTLLQSCALPRKLPAHAQKFTSQSMCCNTFVNVFFHVHNVGGQGEFMLS